MFPKPPQAAAVTPPARRASRIIGAMILVLALMAMAIATYLTWHAYASGPIGGCGASSTFACDEVLSTRWSKWFGIPVAMLAMANYVGVAAAALLLLLGDSRWQRRGAALLMLTAGLATAAAFWFTGLQLFSVQKLCFYCLLAHGCGLTIGILTALLLLLTLRDLIANPDTLRADTASADRGRADSLLPSRSIAFTVLGLISVGCVALVGGQLAYHDVDYEVVDLGSSGAAATPTDPDATAMEASHRLWTRGLVPTA